MPLIPDRYYIPVGAAFCSSEALRYREPRCEPVLPVRRHTYSHGSGAKPGCRSRHSAKHRSQSLDSRGANYITMINR
ncbi:hypothetical protein EYF80_004986 [Liparis tanakae]|uniref:Uncharacterized protein n=1 Tax=Liparis tanakae TaxID=230148 RepID=A0A4Z2J4R7_9TELE|nr:hypothetical protein EYF80_004986 [Liparis tanakae]